MQSEGLRPAAWYPGRSGGHGRSGGAGKYCTRRYLESRGFGARNDQEPKIPEWLARRASIMGIVDGSGDRTPKGGKRAHAPARTSCWARYLPFLVWIITLQLNLYLGKG